MIPTATPLHPATPTVASGDAGGVRRSRVGLLVTALVAMAVVLVVGAASASAHAVLVAAAPADGEQLATTPTSVTFTFSEPVTTDIGGVTVLAADGTSVNVGGTTQPSPAEVRSQLRPDLPNGTYLANYRVVSRDGHVIAGASVFAIGAPPDAASVSGVSSTADRTASVVATVANILLYTGALMAIGMALFSLVVVGGADDRRRLIPWVQASALIAAVGAVGHVVARAAEGTGRGLTAVTESGVLASVLRQGGTGWWLVGLLLGLSVIVASVSLGSVTVRRVLVTYGALVAAGSFALTGHTTQASPAAVAAVADAVHILVAAVWLGGLVGVALIIPWHTGDSSSPVDDGNDTGPRGALAVVSRFTTLAAVAVAVLWVSGLSQAWFTVGNLSGLPGSDYGRILMVKLVVVVVAMAGAAWNRWKLLPAADLHGASASGTVTRLRRTVGLEVLALVMVVMVTSVLVETPSAFTTMDEMQSFNQTLPLTDGVDINISVAPAMVGLNEIHITYIDEQGLLDDRVESVVVEMNLPASGIGPLPANGATLGPGHYVVTTENLTVAGPWRLDVVSRIGLFDQLRTTFEVPIR
jgi:copper transport protein